MAGIMNTLWDESSELEDEILTPRPVLSDDYTTHDVTKLKRLKMQTKMTRLSKSH